MAAKIKRGDNVTVLAGRDRGKSGEVLEVIPSRDRALVQGVNLVRRHTKQSASQESGIYTKPAPIHLSNLALVDPKEKKPTRVGFKITDGKKQRIAKRSGEVIDG